ncbi:MAG: hypothetical protein JWN04_6235 [Myxococcaceae bacterium]|nr:hypothetical protein [Myxococcaceae bacterium]
MQILRLAIAVVLAWLGAASLVDAQDALPPTAWAPRTSFANEADWAAYAQQRVELLATWEEDIRDEWRTAHYGFKRLLSIGSVCLGGLLLAYGTADLSDDTGHGARDVGPAVLLAGGGAALGVGIWALISLKRRRPYRQQEQALRAERMYWERGLDTLQQRWEQQHHVSSFLRSTDVRVSPLGAQLHMRF